MTTSGRGGKTLKKKVTVLTNDPENKEIPLFIKGRVDKIYTLTPKAVALKGIEGETVSQTISLVPGKSFPFTLKEITAKRGEKIKYAFEEIKDKDGVRYEVTVENTTTETGVFFDTLYLKTDSERKPEIKITVFGSITKAPSETDENQTTNEPA